MRKLILIIAILFIASSVFGAWNITTNWFAKKSVCLTVISASSNDTSTNWQMPKRFRGRVLPDIENVTIKTSTADICVYLRCEAVTSKILNFKIFHCSSGKKQDYIKAEVLLIPKATIK